MRHPRQRPAAELDAIARGAERVLIVIAGLLGDTVMSSPVITASRRIWPRARLTLLGQPHNCELLADVDELDERIESVLPFSMRHRDAEQRVAEEIATRRFDVALLVLGDQFARMVADADIPVRVGVRGHVLTPCLTHVYDIGSPRTWGPNERLNALRSLGVDVPALSPRLTASAATVERGATALDRLGLRAGEPYAVVHPFGSTRRQWWPLEHLQALQAHLRDRRGLRTVLIGGADTRAAVPATLASSIVDATGQLSIREMVGVMAGASLVASTDSGPFHIAGALGRPLVGLFRGRRPEHADRYSQARVVFGRYDACAGECAWDRCAAAPCRQMTRIAPHDVMAAADAAAPATEPILTPR